MDAQKKIYHARFLIFTAFALLAFAVPCIVSAESACSSVQMEISQELTIERIAFDAKMVIKNNASDKSLTNIRVDVTIVDSAGNSKNDIFYIKESSLSNITGVDGSGSVGESTTAEAHWLIIPSPGAGGSDPAGTQYSVGATLTYTMDDSNEVISVEPDQITVKPEAQLILDYFTPYQVLGDNPFTTQVEAPVPFPLAVRVMNTGYGAATDLRIDSAQPEIVDNTQGLLVNFQLQGAAVNDSAVSPSLTLTLGTLDSKKIATAYWEMTSTLSGHFKDFTVTFSHASELGGELTSIIQETNAYYLTHRVKVNLPGRDNLLDFLADVNKDPEHIPDAIFESEIPGNTGNVEDAKTTVSTATIIQSPSRPTTEAPEVQMSIAAGTTGWVYMHTTDPAQGLLTLLDVVRADGVHLDPNNFWVDEGLDTDYQTTHTLQFLDYRDSAAMTGNYTLVYTQPADDTTPPTTQLIFDGASKGTDPVSITPETRIIFTAKDNDGGSGVDQMLKKLVGTDTDFAGAYPMTVTQPGSFVLQYYSIDNAGNTETVKSTNIVIDAAAPAISSFQAAPASFSPGAPKGIAAQRTTTFSFLVTDETSTLDATIDIAKGSVFSDSAIVRSIKTSFASGTQASADWDGKDGNGTLAAESVYTARLSVTDGLDSSTRNSTVTATTTVTIAPWFTGQALDPNPSAAQQYPEVSGTMAVWQDKRNGNWDIYRKDVNGTNSIAVTSNSADQAHPSISENIIVWQDFRNGNWDIYGYDISTSQEFAVNTDTGNQEQPVVSGSWVAWQDDRNGNQDIYAYNLSTLELIQVTSHVRDQMHPALSGTTLAWEDYRHGAASIYTYDLTSRAETRYSVSSSNETLPAISPNGLSWTDDRNSQADVYFSSSQYNEARLTYGAGDHSQTTMQGGLIVYTNYEAGAGDPNLSFYDTASNLGAVLSSNTSRQEEPALGTGVLLWQDDRDGIAQIYWAPLQVEVVPIAVEIKQGLNLIAVGDKLSGTYQTANSLIAALPNGIVIEKIVSYSSQNGTFLDTATGADSALQKGTAIGLYASNSGTLDIADSGETGTYTLLSGANYVGMLSIPNGYSAYSLLQSIGYENAQSVRKFNNQTGAWETAAVRTVSGSTSAAGVNFAIQPGDGVIVVMKNRVDGWKP